MVFRVAQFKEKGDAFFTEGRGTVPKCPNCNDTQGLSRHGTDDRWISWCLDAIRILVARFLCPKCGRTVSCLPDWALSYRRVNVHTTQRYL